MSVLFIASLEPALLPHARADVPFLRGDNNQDGQVSISDLQFYTCFIFCGIPCLDAADADDNGQIQLTDLVRILNVIFLGVGTIPAPFPEAGIDPTDDALDCASYEVHAAPATEDLLELGHATGRPGDRVKVTLSLQSAEHVRAFQIALRYDPKSFTPLLPQAEPAKAPFFEGTVFDPATGTLCFCGGFLGALTFPEAGIFRLGFEPSIIEDVEIPPSAEPVPILNILGTIPEDAEVNSVMELAFTEQPSELGSVCTELVSADSLSGQARVPGTLRAGSITVKRRELFIRGDSNIDGKLEISDAIKVLSFLFLGGAEPRCRDAADTDDDGKSSMSDSIRLLGFLFLGGPPPAAPWPDCGEDATEDGLDCTEYPGC